MNGSPNAQTSRRLSTTVAPTIRLKDPAAAHRVPFQRSARERAPCWVNAQVSRADDAPAVITGWLALPGNAAWFHPAVVSCQATGALVPPSEPWNAQP